MHTVESDTDALPAEGEQLSKDTWLNFLYLACTDRRKGFDAYTEFFQSTQWTTLLVRHESVEHLQQGISRFYQRENRIRFTGKVDVE